MSSITYAVDAVPPPRITWLNALQHISLSAVTLVFPRIVAEAAGADPGTITAYVSLAMVAMGIGTLIQAFGRRGIGSGHLLLGHCTILYVPFAVEAARVGGLGAVAGLTIIAGCTEMLLSRCLRALRAYVPPEIIGVVILLLGIMLGVFGIKLMIGAGPGGAAGPLEMAASAITLVTIIAVALWARPGLRSLAVLVGVATGCAAYVTLEIVVGDIGAATGEIALVGPVWPLAMPSFPAEFVPGFLIGALACFIRAIADLTACQQLADPNWKAPDFKAIRAGTLADGLGCVVAGVIGVLGTNTYSGSVGLAAANGVLARRVGIAAGVGWIILGLTPGAASVLYAIPAGILGAACFYSATFTVRTGIAMLAQRLVDSRRTLIIGSAIVIATLAPELRGVLELPLLGQQVMNSPLAAAMLAALALNAVLRLGIPRTATLRWTPENGAAALQAFTDAQGRAWGARVALMARAGNFLEEFGALLPRLAEAGSEAEARLRYDEVGLQIALSWQGAPLAIDAAPNPDADDGSLQVALMRHWADEMTHDGETDGRQVLTVYVDDR
ncbi:solute carrier family 23 protein [Iodidimonas sp. SYSU 1G8]|uniref:solute carrier family 23 protein n=1 Tax=Iodidimonas sp. SYSU 1G8 TaxID=3133967 RepID=UPI0031FEF753